MHLAAVVGRRRIAWEPDGGVGRRGEGLNTTFDEPSECGLACVTDVQAVAAVAPWYAGRSPVDQDGPGGVAGVKGAHRGSCRGGNGGGDEPQAPTRADEAQRPAQERRVDAAIGPSTRTTTRGRVWVRARARMMDTRIGERAAATGVGFDPQMDERRDGQQRRGVPQDQRRPGTSGRAIRRHQS